MTIPAIAPPLIDVFFVVDERELELSPLTAIVELDVGECVAIRVVGLPVPVDKTAGELTCEFEDDGELLVVDELPELCVCVAEEDAAVVEASGPAFAAKKVVTSL
jgi:hypothetical protein